MRVRRLPCQPDIGFSVLGGISSVGRAPALQADGPRFDPAILHQCRAAGFGRRAICGLAPISTGNGAKGARPMASRRALGPGHSRQARPSCPRGALPGGDRGPAIRGSSVAHAPAMAGNAGPRKTTWWCNPRYPHREPRRATGNARQYEPYKRVRARRVPGFRFAAGSLVLGQVPGRGKTVDVLYFLAQKATKRPGRARRNGVLLFSSVVELSPIKRLVAGSSPAVAATSTD